jgi:DNA-binding transcriptional ArsR family regulator
MFNPMVKHSAAARKLDRVFQALSDSTRRDILLKIASREHTVSELAAPYRISLAAVSKHLKVLEGAGLLERAVDGRVHRCSLNPAPLEGALETIRHYQEFWNHQLDALEAFLHGTHGQTQKKVKQS